MHTDSYICLYWLKKPAGNLAIYISNRVKIIQDSQIKIFHCPTDVNPGDFVSKVKPTSSYLNNPIWEHGPKYMENGDWKVGKSIEEIKAERSPTHKEAIEIEEGLRKTTKTVQLNVTQTSVAFSKDNIITLAQTKSNSLLRVQRMIHTCIKFLLKAKFPFSGGRESDGLESSDKPDELDKEQQKSPNADPKWIWAMYQRKWYVARAAINEEIPKSLNNKLSKVKEQSMVVQFAIDEKYSIIPTRKIEPFGNNLDLDLKRSKLDPVGTLLPKMNKMKKKKLRALKDPGSLAI